MRMTAPAEPVTGQPQSFEFSWENGESPSSVIGNMFNEGTNSIVDGQTVWYSFLINFNNGIGDCRVKLFGSIPDPDSNSFFTGTGVRFNYEKLLGLEGGKEGWRRRIAATRPTLPPKDAPSAVHANLKSALTGL